MLDAVRLLSAGYCTHMEAMSRIGAPWRSCRFPSGFALLHHRRHGPILFDTGYTRYFADETRHFPNRLYAFATPLHLQDSETAAEQLARAGIAARDVRHVIVSHFHADHIAGLKDFPRAAILCSLAAWQSVARLRGFAAVRRAFLPGLMPADTETRLRFVDECSTAALPRAMAPFDKGWDVFGDESVLAVELPGHASGQIGVVVSSGASEPVFLIADAAWSHAAVRDCSPPPRVTTAFLGDTATYRNTLRKLHDLHRCNPALRIVPSHETPP
jgi:glyoxylase-like metal-dependent hydrolase (beta-lactamase superfamily II)